MNANWLSNDIREILLLFQRDDDSVYFLKGRSLLCFRFTK